MGHMTRDPVGAEEEEKPKQCGPPLEQKFAGLKHS